MANYVIRVLVLVVLTCMATTAAATPNMQIGKHYVLERDDGSILLVELIREEEDGALTLEDVNGRVFTVQPSAVVRATPYKPPTPRGVPSRQYFSLGYSAGEYFGYPHQARGLGFRLLAVHGYRFGFDFIVHEGASLRFSGGRVAPLIKRRTVTGFSADVALLAGYHQLFVSADRMSHGANLASEWTLSGWGGEHLGIALSMRIGADLWLWRAPRYPEGELPGDGASNRKIPIASPDLRAMLSLTF